MEKSIVKPNLFIVGAAKSATTSVYNYLNHHPEIYFSNPKEPRYLSYKYEKFPHNGPNGNLYDSSFIKNEQEYFNLFNDVSIEKVIGEASIQYLYYPQIAGDIKQNFPNSKIIICLRNPIERAYSAYTHNLRGGFENLDFYNALEAENERIAKNYPFLWHYKNVGLYYRQVKEYLRIFGRENVKIILYEDIKNKVHEILIDLCEFLEVNSNFEFKNAEKIYNKSGNSNNKIVNYMTKQNKIKRLIKSSLTPRFVRDLSYSFYNNILNKFLTKVDMKHDEREYLKKYFEEDIFLLESLIERDLSNWVK